MNKIIKFVVFWLAACILFNLYGLFLCKTLFKDMPWITACERFK